MATPLATGATTVELVAGDEERRARTTHPPTELQLTRDDHNDLVVGMRVRADAGAASFRRQASLDEHLKEASELVQTLKTQAQTDPGLAKRQAQAAQLRAAQEREERIRAALKQLPEVAAAKKRNGSKAEARASTTDADARVMNMGDGGFRPAFNVPFATPCAVQVAVSIDVVQTSRDMAQTTPMVCHVPQLWRQSLAC